MANKIDRIDLYLQWNQGASYTNTPDEEYKLTKFHALYCMAKAARDSIKWANPENLVKWRKAYEGSLNALKQDGTESTRRSRQLRKLMYEIVESKIDNSIPMAIMNPQHKRDTITINTTEDYLKFEINRIYTKYMNDRSERSTYIDGTVWYKVWWDSLDSTYENGGQVKVDVCTCDQIIPQPSVTDWRQLEYIFEIEQLSLARIYDLYGRIITPASSNQSVIPTQQGDLSTITVINCYYLNDKRIVGKFSWAKDSMQVICDEEDWQIRKLRTCTKCGHIQNLGDTCAICGSKSFKYKNAETEILEEDLYEIYNPYEEGETDDESKKDQFAAKLFATAGTEIPFYVVRQLPFIPRPAVSSMDTIYGISDVYMHLDMQDGINKMLTKAMNKSLSSCTLITKPGRVKIDTTDENSIKFANVKTYEEAQQVRNVPIEADINQELAMVSSLYDSAKSSSGITDSFQGKYDASATSGKAKQFQAIQTAGRIESLRVMKAAAFAGIYEMVLKYLLAFSDNRKTFVKVLPDGQTKEEVWSKYMFLAKSKDGQYYYRDDFSFSSDPAAVISPDRMTMWQETVNKFTLGMFGDVTNSNTLKSVWHILKQQGYPLANEAIAAIQDNEKKLPPQIEQMLVEHPEVVQIAMQLLQAQQSGTPGAGTGQQGGARAGAGRDGNGFTHAANVDRTNARNEAQAATEVKTEVGNIEGAIR